jgi:parvulin-like peptidyl-prolyl isomerase
VFSKRLTIISVAFASALILAACGDDDGGGSSPEVVATINGTDITAAQVDEQFGILSQSSGEVPEGTTQEDYDRQLTISGLNQLIFGQLLLDGAAGLEIEVTDEDVDATREELIVQFGGEDELYDQLEEQQGMDRAEVDRQIEILATQNAIIESLTADITDEQIQTAYDDGASARHILVADEAAANDVMDRLDAGEDFAAIASEVSTDTGSAATGGELGFNPPGVFVAEFDDALFGASDGEVVGPIETSFGFHIIERLDKPAIADVEAQIRTQLEQLNGSSAEQEYGALIDGWVQEAEVTIHHPEYGVWDAEGGLVVDDLEDSEETDDSGDTTPTPTPTDG